jgi:FkbM family methyltransferase
MVEQGRATLKSQAEHEVDRLVYEAFFRDTRPGVFVDVGAARPDFLSISALYQSLGWRVMAVEPNPAFAEEQRAAGREVLPYACADYDADDVDFEVVDSHGAEYEGGEVSFESFSALRIKDSYRALREDSFDVRHITVNVRRLDTILAEHAPELDRLDIVSIDVEGWELEVLAGLSLKRYKPRVLIVENLFDDPTYSRVLRKRGYRLWNHIGPNDVYVPAGRGAWRSWLRRS